ncbi:MAG: class I SAM-dependent methyltransferase [Thermoplasmata archaeon]|jgi:SAM-dependent methyltransferase
MATTVRPGSGPRRETAARASIRRKIGPPAPSAVNRPAPPRARFLELDRYRAEREWLRYEGTAQRDLFRELRMRLLDRNHPGDGRSLDLGCGPGRFLAPPNLAPSSWVGIDLSREMLRRAAGEVRKPSRPDLIRADGLEPPFRPGVFSWVQLLGNVLGFSGEFGPELLDATLALVRPGGRFLVEIAPGPGEASRYLLRLPPTVVRRLLDGKGHGLLSAIEREGFRPVRSEAEPGVGFRRWSAAEILRYLRDRNFDPLEVMAIAPLLGSDPERIEAAAASPTTWRSLLQWEEAVGRNPDRWWAAAAVILVAQRTASGP